MNWIQNRIDELKWIPVTHCGVIKDGEFLIEHSFSGYEKCKAHSRNKQLFSYSSPSTGTQDLIPNEKEAV
jgi:hypothetical protein